MRASRSASARFSSKLRVVEAFITAMSAPAQNDGPWPPSTTTRTASSWASAWSCSAISAPSSGESALCCSARSSQKRATGPSRTIFTIALIAASHAEHAEAHRRNRSVQAGRQREGQHVARLGRIDDAVVPEPRGGEVGAALPLVGVENRLLERAHFFVRHRLLRARLLDLRQHRGGLLAAHHADPAVRPHEEKARLIRAPAHAVVARAEAAA